MYSRDPVRRTAKGLAVALAVVLAPRAGPQPLRAQQLTVRKIFTSSAYYARELPDVGWTPDGRAFTFLAAARRGSAIDLLAQDAKTGRTRMVVDGNDLVPPGATAPLSIDGYRFSPDGTKLLIDTNTKYVWRDRTEGTYYLYDLRSDSLRPLSTAPGEQQFAKFSPDGTRVGFVRHHDLFVVDLATGKERRLTHDGSDLVFNGTVDWVYEEELGLQDGWRWSPDGRRIAYWQVDDHPVRNFDYDFTYEELYPHVVSVRYPLAGQENPVARIGVVGLDGGKTRWMDVPDRDVYVARMEWAKSSDQVLIQGLNRHQDHLDVMLADVKTGRSRVILTDSSDTWVDVDNHFRWIGDGSRFLWSSEQDGYNHLYLYDRSGHLVRKLTKGDWVIDTPVSVDDDGGWVYFTAHRRSPLQTNLYRVSVDGGDLQRVTPGDGTHQVDMNPGGTYFLDTYSRAGVPPTTSVRRGDGSAVRTLVRNGDLADRLDSLGLRRPEFFQFTTSDGVRLNGWMIKPPDFDPSRKYPVLMYVYGGPGDQRVTDGWGGVTYLWHQLLAERGYIVACVDGRGTGGRGRAFKNVTFLHLGHWEAHDQIEAARYLGSLDYVDPGRIGIYGASYGGYVTLLSMMEGSGTFRAGIARSPVTDWRLYDTIYTERYMHLPDENPRGYADSAPMNHVKDLQGSLLLIHGTGDDNVHFQNSVRLVQKLQEDGKQFQFMMYPNKTHDLRGLQANEHLYIMMARFIQEHL